MRNLLIITMLAVALAACGGQARQEAGNGAQSGDNKHTVKYITHRLNSIFADAYGGRQTLLDLDRKYMTREYLDLQDRAIAIGQRDGNVVIDADHWVQGQDVADPMMRVDSVLDITQQGAFAYVTIVNMGYAVNVQLPLVFERDDWYIDDFFQDFEGEPLSEKEWYRSYVEHDGRFPDDE